MVPPPVFSIAIGGTLVPYRYYCLCLLSYLCNDVMMCYDVGGTLAQIGGALVPVGGTLAQIGGALVPIGGTLALIGGALVPIGGTLAHQWNFGTH